MELEKYYQKYIKYYNFETEPSNQDKYFYKESNEPNVTKHLFRNDYKQYNNFSIGIIDIEPNVKKELKFNNETTLKFNINRNADLITHMYFSFELPEIYSIDIDATTTAETSRDFKWIQRLGEYIINHVSFYIDNVKINELYGEWLHIWSELNLSKEQKEGYNRSIGNISDLFNPGEGNYPGTNDDETFKVPSIRKTTIIVPIPFFFSYNYKLALPLINLQSSECKVEINLKSLRELYTIYNTTDEFRRRPNNSDSENFGKFMDINLTPSFTYSGNIIQSLDIKPLLKVNYIYLDNQERLKFTGNVFDSNNNNNNNSIYFDNNYLITKIHTHKVLLKSNIKTHRIDISGFTGHCSKICWILRRTDYKDNNQWHNFTNWPDKDKDPLFNEENFDEFSTGETINTNNYNSLKYKDIVSSAVLKFKNDNIFEIKNNNVFNLINNYSHSKNIPEDGIYVYSFELLTDKNNYQPTGSYNLSNKSEIYLDLVLINTEINKTYDYEIYVFAQTYNNLLLLSGMGNLQFSN